MSDAATQDKVFLQAKPHEPQPGEVLAQKYELRQIVGRGGFGLVYDALHLGIGRQVALKVLLPQWAHQDRELAIRFRREAVLASQLRHPNTITLYDYGQTDDGTLYMAMEFVDGITLSSVLRDEAPLTDRRTVHILKQILSSLQEAHARGIIHRDLKPGNIMLTSHGGDPEFVKVLDFGIAKAISPDLLGGDQASQTLTQAGQFCGTPRYMAPEQFRNNTVTPACDLYSVGLISYELLTGKPAVLGETMVDLIVSQVAGPSLTLPPEANVPAGLRSLIERALRKAPEERFSSAAVFADALDQWENPEPIYSDAIRVMGAQDDDDVLSMDTSEEMTIDISPSAGLQALLSGAHPSPQPFSDADDAPSTFDQDSPRASRRHNAPDHTSTPGPDMFGEEGTSVHSSRADTTPRTPALPDPNKPQAPAQQRPAPDQQPTRDLSGTLNVNAGAPLADDQAAAPDASTGEGQRTPFMESALDFKALPTNPNTADNAMPFLEEEVTTDQLVPHALRDDEEALADTTTNLSREEILDVASMEATIDLSRQRVFEEAAALVSERGQSIAAPKTPISEGTPKLARRTEPRSAPSPAQEVNDDPDATIDMSMDAFIASQADQNLNAARPRIANHARMRTQPGSTSQPAAAPSKKPSPASQSARPNWPLRIASAIIVLALLSLLAILGGQIAYRSWPKPNASEPTTDALKVIRLETTPKSPVTITVRSKPVGVRVFHNDRLIGSTPLKLIADKNQSHPLRFKLDKHISHEADLKFRQDREFFIQLTPAQ